MKVLKMNPAISAIVLRPLLKAALPCQTNIDRHFIQNFKKGAAIDNAKDSNRNFYQQGMVMHSQVTMI